LFENYRSTHNKYKDVKLVSEHLQYIQQAVHPLIDPKRLKNYRKYSKYRNDKNKNSDLSKFLFTIGAKTSMNGGRRKLKRKYGKLWEKIKEQLKSGYYIITGQDAYEMPTGTATIIEEILYDHVSNDWQSKDLGFCQIYLIEWRP
jgi:hypothetical protein